MPQAMRYWRVIHRLYLISEIAKATKQPERVILTHYLNPPHVMPVVEVVKGDKTSEETINITREMMIKIGKTSVVLAKQFPDI